ncbi:calpain-10-like [Lampetra fluviatilis]
MAVATVMVSMAMVVVAVMGMAVATVMASMAMVVVAVMGMAGGDGDGVDGDGGDGGRAVRRPLPCDWFERLGRLAEGGWVTCCVHHGASTDALGGFHAFSVLGTSETRGEKSLLLWNTWGRHGLGTPGAGVEPGVEPGELRVGEADFPDLFDEVTLGYPIMPCGGGLVDILTGSLLPHVASCKGRWVRGVSTGGSRNCPGYVRNPVYLVTLGPPGGALLVALCQLLPQCHHHHHRHHRHHHHEEEEMEEEVEEEVMEAIGVHVWRVSGS